MIALNAIKRVYFIGIGGIGMSALARFFMNRGCQVWGYDRTVTPLTSSLTQEGMEISYDDDLDSLPGGLNADDPGLLVVYTPAIPANSVLLKHFKLHGFLMMKRSEVLGVISKGQFCIAIAGTHGKTTTSSIVAHLLTDSGYGCTAFLGGIANNYNSNFILGSNNVVVVEADEYDRSFLTLYPDIEVITSMDADHLDIYGDENVLHESFRLFSDQLKSNGTLIIKNALPINKGTTYGVDTDSDIRSSHLRVEDAMYVFDYKDKNHQIADLRLALPGRHNVENATAAIAIALQLGISADKIKNALGSFRGVRRRFEYLLKQDKVVFIDDYAHHPAELRACFSAVRELYLYRKMTVIFQPHLYTRTRDFAEEFAEVLSTADDLILLDIYPARELPIEGVSSEVLLEKITSNEKLSCKKEDVLDLIKGKKPELLLTVGAGDIDTLIQPLKDLLLNGEKY